MKLLFGVFPIFFFIVFAFVIGVFIFVFVKGIGQWRSNNASPRLTVEARIVDKRQHVSHSHHHGTHTHTTSSSSYFVTFEVESGDRMELCVPSAEFGLLIVGDEGKLSFQGTRYLGFERLM